MDLSKYNIVKADTFWKRTLGLMGRKDMPDNEALLLSPCSSVHTFFMRFPIDLVWLGESMNIVRVDKDVMPWQIRGCKNAYQVLEIKSDTYYKKSGCDSYD